MGSNVDKIKERLDIVEVVSSYAKLEKAGANWKGRCPFHNEKTPSFFVSASRQGYYCFGCGAKGDMFTFVQEMEGVDFREALSQLAEKAGVELKYEGSEANTDKESMLKALDDAASFFEEKLAGDAAALSYVHSRGITDESIKHWRLGLAPEPEKGDWRMLYSHLLSLGHSQEIILKSGLAKLPEGKEKAAQPYDVFRGRIVFPLSDASGRIVGFSGRGLSGETVPKYLNSPDTALFTKSELLYGFDKAKEDIRRKDYAVLVEGQLDLVLSHQAGVKNTVASSGTAFTEAHLERLKRLSNRLIFAFDGDEAGEKAAERSAILALSIGMDVKIARLPEGGDPAELVEKKPELWKDVLREAKPAIEHFLERVLEGEKDERKRGRLIEKKILPLIALLSSAIERSHFISLVAKRTGIREEMLWEDMRLVSAPDIRHSDPVHANGKEAAEKPDKRSRKEVIEERLSELAHWRNEFKGEKAELEMLDREESELKSLLSEVTMKDELSALVAKLSGAEAVKDEAEVLRLTQQVQNLHKEMHALEEKRKIM